MSNRLPSPSLLDTGDIPVANIAKLAKREGTRPRQTYQAHKWFARRFAVTARSLLVAAMTPAGSKFWPAYYGKASCEGLSVLDPFMGGGVMLLEAARLGAGIQGVDVEPVATVISNFQGRLWEMQDIDTHVKAIADRVRSRLASFYLSCDEQGTAETLLHTFWVQVVPCGHCGYRFDAHPFFRIAWDKKNNRQWVACRSCSRILEGEFHHRSLRCDCGVRTNVHGGHCQYGTARCPSCGHRERLIDVWVRTGNRPDFRIFAVETLPGGTERRFPTVNRRIRTASEFDRKRFEAARRELE
jgi:hypothetical protein